MTIEPPRRWEVTPAGAERAARRLQGPQRRLTELWILHLREQMRGVVVHPDGIELRELLSFGWPKVRRLAWSQIDRVSVPPAAPRPAAKASDPGKKTDPATIRLDLWDGTRAWLPNVSNPAALGLLLEKVALARAIPIEGGTGLLDDLGNPLEDEG